jgi:hypothetical protein
LGKRSALFCQGEAWATTVELERAALASRKTYDFGNNPLLLVNVVFISFFIEFLNELSTGDPAATF